MAKSMPPLIDVRSAKARGASIICAEKSFAVASSRMTVQSMTIFCAPTPDHSIKETAILPSAPECGPFVLLARRGVGHHWIVARPVQRTREEPLEMNAQLDNVVD